ncbi:hypothetical protein [Paraburkholderia dilworthii]|nr:hypothetical protein [Paraburkholderia dilworthii]
MAVFKSYPVATERTLTEHTSRVSKVSSDIVISELALKGIAQC